MTIVEIDQELVEQAVGLAMEEDLRSLDALHLASALMVADQDILIATWDQRLHAAAHRRVSAVFPERL